MYICVKCIEELTKARRYLQRTVRSVNDETVLAMLRDNDEKGLDAAMGKYSRLVRSIAAGMLNSEEDIEEVTSDTFYKVWNNRAEIDTEKGSLKNYVCMVARSCTINKLRTVSVTEPLPDDERDLGLEVDFSTEYAAEHNRKVIAQCIRELSSPDREVFINRFYYSLTHAEIASRLGLTEKRVEYILHKSKRRLRDALTKGGILL